MGIRVEQREDEDSKNLLRRFLRLVKRDGVLRRYTEASRYQKPSEKKRSRLNRQDRQFHPPNSVTRKLRAHKHVSNSESTDPYYPCPSVETSDGREEKTVH